MIMVFIAPTISKSLMQPRACEHHQPMTMMDMPHSEHEMAEPAACANGMMAHMLLMPDTGQSPMEQIACGYCQLLVHLPVILFVFAMLLRLLAHLTRWVAYPDYCHPTLFRPWSPQCARAPPVTRIHFSF